MNKGPTQPPSWKLRRDTFQQSHPSSTTPDSTIIPPHWHSRGYLPHFDQAGIVQSYTFRLDDALPMSVLQAWKRELAQIEDTARQLELRRRIDHYLDAGHGKCWLKIPEIATMVEGALLHFDSQRYHLLAWCVMPNHVHAVVETVAGFSNSDVIHSWKGFTSHQANKHLQREGGFWQRDYYDREVRDGAHYERLVLYVENNPVKAGLVAKADEWKWSSARWERRKPSMRIG